MGRKRTVRHAIVRSVRLYHLLLVFLLISPAVSLGQRLVVTPSLAVGERYDDNIFQENDKEDDFVTVITPGINLLYRPSVNTSLDFTYRPSLEFFKDHSDENQVSHYLLFKTQGPVSRRLTMNLYNRLVITDEPADRDRNRPLSPSDLSSGLGQPPTVNVDDLPEGGTRDTSRESRDHTIRNFANAELGILLASRTVLDLRFGSLYENVEDPDEVDEFRYNAGAGLGYITSVVRKNKLSVGYDVAFFTFHPNSPTAPDTSDFRVQTPHIDYLHNFNPTLAAELSFGYSLTDSDDPALDDNTGFTGSIDLTKTLRTGAASLRYVREFTSGRGDGDQVLADRVLAIFSSRISPKVTARFVGGLSWLNFKVDDNDDRLYYSASPSLIYEAVRFWRLSLAYTYEYTDYDASNRADRTNHRVAFISQFIFRQGLSLDLTYEFRTRRFGSGQPDDEEFDRNMVMLSITYAPALRF
jgi:hypothetical protein